MVVEATAWEGERLETPPEKGLPRFGYPDGLAGGGVEAGVGTAPSLGGDSELQMICPLGETRTGGGLQHMAERTPAQEG